MGLRGTDIVAGAAEDGEDFERLPGPFEPFYPPGLTPGRIGLFGAGNHRQFLREAWRRDDVSLGVEQWPEEAR